MKVADGQGKSHAIRNLKHSEGFYIGDRYFKDDTEYLMSMPDVVKSIQDGMRDIKDHPERFRTAKDWGIDLP